MNLIHPEYNNTTKSFNGAHFPTKTIYVKTNEKLIPNDNYYFCLLIEKSLICLTNKFKKVIIDQLEMYEIDFFVEKITLPLHLCKYHSISIMGFLYSPKNIKMYTFTDIYCEIDTTKLDPYTDTSLKIIAPHTDSALIIAFAYHDSELTEKIRSESTARKKIKNSYKIDADNVITFKDGMCNLAYIGPYYFMLNSACQLGALNLDEIVFKNV